MEAARASKPPCPRTLTVEEFPQPGLPCQARPISGSVSLGRPFGPAILPK